MDKDDGDALLSWCDEMEAKYASPTEYDYGVLMAVAGLRQKLAALRQQRGEVPLSEKVRRILVESESWEDNRDVESPAAGWMLKVPQKLFIRMISTLKERTE